MSYHFSKALSYSGSGPGYASEEYWVKKYPNLQYQKLCFNAKADKTQQATLYASVQHDGGKVAASATFVVKQVGRQFCLLYQVPPSQHWTKLNLVTKVTKGSAKFGVMSLYEGGSKGYPASRWYELAGA